MISKGLVDILYKNHTNSILTANRLYMHKKEQL